MTYNEAYDLIIDAYFKDEIEPMNNSFCFCGTLNKNELGWRCNGNKHYSAIDFGRMEDALFEGMRNFSNDFYPYLIRPNFTAHPDYEDALFTGMCAALDVLKQIHIERGEKIDEPTQFVKRQLV